MRLRQFRYFVAVAEANSFLGAARRLKVAQPAVSKQIRLLEKELGVALFLRLARGVRLTAAGDALLPEARATLAAADHAVEAARRVGEVQGGALHFAHGELVVFAPQVASLLTAFRADGAVREVHVSEFHDESALVGAVREGRVDVAALFTTEWPVIGFEAHRLLACPATGVLLSASHPLASRQAVRAKDLRGLTHFRVAGGNWPQIYRVIDRVLKTRGLVPAHIAEGSAESANVQIAAGAAFTLANEISAELLHGTPSIVYRPFSEPPIPGWLALVWLPGASPAVRRLVRLACSLGLEVPDNGVTGNVRSRIGVDTVGENAEV